MDLPLRPIANRFGGCFCLGSGPVFCVLVCFRLFASLFPLAKRKSGWGICGSSFLVWWCFSSCCLYRFAYSEDFFVLVQSFACLLTGKDRAISATSATLEEKKIIHQVPTVWNYSDVGTKSLPRLQVTVLALWNWNG